MNRFWSRKIVVAEGFEVLGLDFGNNSAYNFYIKRFPGDDAILIFDAFENKMNLYQLSPSDYEGFSKGLFGITYKEHKHNTYDATGNLLKFLKANDITAKTKHQKIERINHMREAIIIAELIVESKLINHEY